MRQVNSHVDHSRNPEPKFPFIDPKQEGEIKSGTKNSNGKVTSSMPSQVEFSQTKFEQET